MKNDFYFYLHSHWMTSKLNCWMAPILICLSSVSSSICISDVDRCLQADIQAVWATLPCREGQWGGRTRNETEEERMQKKKERWKGVGKIKMTMRRTLNKEEKAGREALWGHRKGLKWMKRERLCTERNGVWESVYEGQISKRMRVMRYKRE